MNQFIFQIIFIFYGLLNNQSSLKEFIDNSIVSDGGRFILTYWYNGEYELLSGIDVDVKIIDLEKKTVKDVTSIKKVYFSSLRQFYWINDTTFYCSSLQSTYDINGLKIENIPGISPVFYYDISMNMDVAIATDLKKYVWFSNLIGNQESDKKIEFQHDFDETEEFLRYQLLSVCGHKELILSHSAYKYYAKEYATSDVDIFPLVANYQNRTITKLVPFSIHNKYNLQKFVLTKSDHIYHLDTKERKFYNSSNGVVLENVLDVSLASENIILVTKNAIISFNEDKGDFVEILSRQNSEQEKIVLYNGKIFSVDFDKNKVFRIDQ